MFRKINIYIALLITFHSFAYTQHMENTPSTSNEPEKNLLVPTSLTKYIDELPILPVQKPLSIQNGIAKYRMVMTEFKQKLHSQLPETTVWGYNGMTPGPIIEAYVNNPIFVEWVNNLPLKHLLASDIRKNKHTENVPEVRTVVHLHGSITPPEYDGYPMAWYTPGNSATYYYPNISDGFYSFYHDHTIGITEQNVYAGLTGIFILKDPADKVFNLPEGKFDIALAIQDRSFNKDGSLHLNFCSGDIAMVNGKIWPYLNVEPRKYRLRLLNGSDTRIYRFKFSTGQSFFQIASDSGLLAKPVYLDQIVLAPAERAEIIVDFSQNTGQNIILQNDVGCYGPGFVNDPLPEIMQFRVALPPSNNFSADKSTVPAEFRPLSPSKEELQKSINKVRYLTLEGPIGDDLLFLLDKKFWHDPITEKPLFNTVELWNLINLDQENENNHPIHLHLVRFYIIDRIPFNVDEYIKDRDAGKLKPIQSYVTGDPVLPDPDESGFKDTIQAKIGYITRIIMRFSGFPGRFVWHCHTLEHEDFDMMRPFEVVISETSPSVNMEAVPEHNK